MPDALIAYEFSYEDVGCMILAESQIIHAAVIIVKPPALYGVCPALRVGRPKAGGLLTM